MNYDTIQFDGERAYLLPIGDIHYGDRACSDAARLKLQGNLDWLVEHRHEARAILMGDVFNMAGRLTKTSPFESDPGEIRQAIEFFRPYAPLIVGAIRGNHERRCYEMFGFDPLELFCDQLGIKYWGISAVLKIQVGRRPAPESGSFWQTYYVYTHHTTGGGRSLGSALNVVTRLQDIITGCDVYCGGHNHQLVTGVKTVFQATANGPKDQKVHFVSCGSYLGWEESYAEEAMMAPSKLGSPRLRFSGVRNHHDVHISI